MDEMIKDTANALETLLEAPVTLRQLAINLYGDERKVGLLTDVRARHYGHVSHATLHDLRRRLGLSYEVRHIVDVPADADAGVYVAPNGTGTFHVEYLPPDTKIVMLPPGARIVQPRAQRKPAKRRWRLDLTEYAGKITADEVRRLVQVWLECDVPVER